MKNGNTNDIAGPNATSDIAGGNIGEKKGSVWRC